MHLPVLWLLFVEMVLFSVFAFLYIKENVVYALHSKTNGSIVVPFFLMLFVFFCFCLFSWDIHKLLHTKRGRIEQSQVPQSEPFLGVSDAH